MYLNGWRVSLLSASANEPRQSRFKTLLKYWQSNKVRFYCVYTFQAFFRREGGEGKGRGWITMQCLINLHSLRSYCGVCTWSAPSRFHRPWIDCLISIQPLRRGAAICRNTWPKTWRHHISDCHSDRTIW